MARRRWRANEAAKDIGGVCGQARLDELDGNGNAGGKTLDFAIGEQFWASRDGRHFFCDRLVRSLCRRFALR